MHTLIVGTTLSGKTTLAKKLAQATYNNNRSVIVYDPIGDKSWLDFADKVTGDAEQFLKLANENYNCTLFIDEANIFCGRYDKSSFWLATRSRHKGHRTIFISQRATDISRTIRDQCDELFCFRVSPYDAKELSTDFVEQSLISAPDLEKGECFYVKRFESCKKIKIFS